MAVLHFPLVPHLRLRIYRILFLDTLLPANGIMINIATTTVGCPLEPLSTVQQPPADLL